MNDDIEKAVYEVTNIKWYYIWLLINIFAAVTPRIFFDVDSIGWEIITLCIVIYIVVMAIILKYDNRRIKNFLEIYYPEELLYIYNDDNTPALKLPIGTCKAVKRIEHVILEKEKFDYELVLFYSQLRSRNEFFLILAAGGLIGLDVIYILLYCI